MKPTILLISLLLIGCTQVIEKEVIVYQNQTINNTITIPCNITVLNTTNTTCPIYNNTPRERELELIRRLKFLEGQTDRYFNDSECNDDLNRTEVKLDDCEEELCGEWNSSWC